MLTHVMTSLYAGENNALECGEATAVGSSGPSVLFQMVQKALRPRMPVD